MGFYVVARRAQCCIWRALFKDDERSMVGFSRGLKRVAVERDGRESVVLFNENSWRQGYYWFGKAS